MTIFKLPDLGEGLPDAEIVKWLVAEGAEIALGDPMVEMSTAKAVVEVPAPFSGKVVKLHGGEGDVIDTGAALVTFALNGEGVAVEESPVEEAEPVAEPVAAPVESAADDSGEGPDGIEVFNLPDLGEGLPDAEIVKWLIAEGDEISVGDDMVEMSTAKAVVEVPSPLAGVVVSLYGAPGDVIDTGNPLIAIRTGKAGASAPAAPAEKGKVGAVAEPVQAAEGGDTPADTGTVVGEITVGNEIKSETAASRDGVRASPAVRATARKMKIDLASIKGSGAAGEITLKDVRTATDSGADRGAAKPVPTPAPAAAPVPASAPAPKLSAGDAKIGPAARNLAHDLGLDLTGVSPTGPKGTVTRQDVVNAAKEQMTSSAPVSQAAPIPVSSGKGVKAAPRVRAYAREKGIDIAAVPASGGAGNVTIDDVNAALKADFSAPGRAPRSVGPYSRPARSYDVSGAAEKVIGPRRVMANMMAKANAEICHTPIFDEADISAWTPGTDITVRIMRAVIAGAYVEPAINAWYSHDEPQKTIHGHVSLGVAVDSPRGLFVPVIKNIDAMSNADMRADLDRHRKAIGDGSIGPKDMSGATITLSNYGMLAGKFAAPIISAPEVAIVGVGGLYDKLVMDSGGIANHRFMPVSLTFDHRACTGGEAARFLRGVLDDLELAS